MSYEVTLGAFWVGLVTRKIKPCLEAWNVNPPTPFSREWKRAGNGVNDQLYLHYASTEIPKVWVGESFQVGEHTQVLESGTPREVPEALCSFPSCISPICMCICILYHILLQ